MRQALRLVPIPVSILIFSILCPVEFSLFIGGLRLPPHRFILLALLPIAIYRLISSRNMRFSAFDFLFICFGVWTLVVYWFHDGRDGFVYGGSLALESLGGYFVARAFIRTPDMLRATLKVVLLAVIIAATIALPEFLLNRTFTHDILKALTGFDHPTGVETRLGLTRAYGTFDHPIHFGTFCASLMALLVYAGRSNRQSRKRAGLLTGATFLSLSSAPLLSLALQGVLILWDQLTRRLKTRLSLSLIAVAVGYVALDLISTRSPMAILATRLTLDSWTGYYRLFIWEHGMNNVWSAPLLGLGLADWARPWWMVADTVDSYWLVLAMRQGIPSFLVLVIALGLIIFATNRKVRQLPDRHARNLLRGWTMSLVALCLIGLTVHYWNALHTYMFFLIGMGGVFADPVRRSRAATVGSQNQSAHRLQKRNLRVPQPLPEAYALSARETVKGQHPITQAAAGLKRTGTGSRNRQPATSIAHSLKPPPIPRGAS